MTMRFFTAHLWQCPLACSIRMVPKSSFKAPGMLANREISVCCVNFQNSQAFIALNTSFVSGRKLSHSGLLVPILSQSLNSARTRNILPHFSHQTMLIKGLSLSPSFLSKTPIQLDKCRLRQCLLLKTILCTMSMLLVILKNRLRYQNSRYSSFFWYSLRNLLRVWSSIRSSINSSERLV